MRNFKIKVTPKESEVIQKLLFLAGYTWGDDSTEIMPTISPYLFFDNDNHNYQVLTKTNSENRFNEINHYEITFEQFITEIEIELNMKFQNKSYY